MKFNVDDNEDKPAPCNSLTKMNYVQCVQREVKEESYPKNKLFHFDMDNNLRARVSNVDGIPRKFYDSVSVATVMLMLQGMTALVGIVRGTFC